MDVRPGGPRGKRLYKAKPPPENPYPSGTPEPPDDRPACPKCGKSDKVLLPTGRPASSILSVVGTFCDRCMAYFTPGKGDPSVLVEQDYYPLAVQTGGVGVLGVVGHGERANDATTPT